MTEPARLLDILLRMSDDAPFTSILATTFTFDPEFFVSTGILPALAGELDRNRTATGERRRRVDAEVIRDQLGNPFVGVLQGCPSPSGATPGWIDRYLWPTRRLGVLHAKCLLAVGWTKAHVLVTSANLTEGSWCRNIEVAASWSAPRAAKNNAERRRVSAIAEVAVGIARLANLAEATAVEHAARTIALDFGHTAPAAPTVVWSGGRFAGRPLDLLKAGDQVIAISPFWAADDRSAAHVMDTLGRLAPTVELVGRSLPGSTALELPGALENAAHAAGARLAIARPSSTTGETDADTANRMLHAKQVTVRSGGRWHSYVGSANATAQGLALTGRSNVELGVIVEAGPLLSRLDATQVRPPEQPPDPDDPAVLLDAKDDWAGIYARAFLDPSGSLHVHVEPAPARAVLEVPTGGAVRGLRRRIDQLLRLGEDEADALVRRAEVALVLSTANRIAVPVVLDEALKLRTGSSATATNLDLDELLARLAANPLRRPSDDDPGPAGTEDLDPPMEDEGRRRLGAPRKPVHRARDAIEVITAAEEPLRAFIASKPPERLLELRLGGAGSIVDLARRAACTNDTPHSLTSLAAAFVVTEIALLLDRLRHADPDAAPVLKKLTSEIATDLDDLLNHVEREDAVAARRLRKLRVRR